MLIIEPADPKDPEVQKLLQESRALMAELYEPDENFALDYAAYEDPAVTLYKARRMNDVLGVGALARHKGYGELKSMYTTTGARGTGVGAALLRQIEDEARRQGLTHLRLETGEELGAAIRLYEKNGFTRCAAFGDYPENGVSVFMEKTLGP